jgi:hypothetical protein
LLIPLVPNTTLPSEPFFSGFSALNPLTFPLRI